MQEAAAAQEEEEGKEEKEEEEKQEDETTSFAIANVLDLTANRYSTLLPFVTFLVFYYRVVNIFRETVWCNGFIFSLLHIPTKTYSPVKKCK